MNFFSFFFLVFRLESSLQTDKKEKEKEDSLLSSLNVNKCDYIEISAEEGVMILMPSWLHHAVIPLSVKKEYRQKKEGMRISLAFNFNEI